MNTSIYARFNLGVENFCKRQLRAKLVKQLIILMFCAEEGTNPETAAVHR